MLTRSGDRGQVQFDVIVLGGGINGTAIARDAAMRGLTVLLIEKDDISNATSAWNSRLIHGGIRYLEYHEVDLVRESLREREWLLHAAPHLVKPLPMLMPFLRGAKRPPLLLRAGMLAYDILSINKSMPHHRLFKASRAVGKVPGLDPDQLRGAALFYDAQVEFAERLSVENMLSAREHGAQVLTHSRANRLVFEGRRVAGVEYTDLISGWTATARARVTVNATGPWADELLDGVPGHTQPLIGGTKGTHIVVDPFPGAPAGCAMYFEARSDRRPIFLIPWRDRYLIGCTDIRYRGDADEARADEAEIDYILSEVNLVLPGAKLTRASVRFIYTGVRPLPWDPDDDPARITRHHIVHDHAPGADGLVTIVGGKLTTFRSLGQDAVDLVVRKLGRRGRKCQTRREALPGGRVADFEAFAESFRSSVDCTDRTSKHLLSVYGVRAPEVVALVRSDRELGRVFDERSGAIGAEVVYAVRSEGARTLTDVIMRRTMLGLDPELPIESVDAAAAVMGRHESWGRSRISKEVEAYGTYAARFRLPSSGNGSGRGTAG